MLEFHIEDLLYTKSTIAYQSDRRIPAQRSRLPEGALRIRSVRATRSRSCLCSVRFVLRVTQKIMHLAVLKSTLNRGYSRPRAEFLHVIAETCN